MSTTLAHTVTLITGSSRGIGRAIALACAAAGSDIILNNRRGGTQIEILGAAIEAGGVRTLLLPADVAEPTALEQLVQDAWSWQGHVDLWVNNAGADILTGENLHQSWEQKLQRLLTTDLWGTVRSCQLAGQRLIIQGHGHIINIGWDQAEQGNIASTSGQLFSLIKGGIMAYTRALARALAPTVRANCVAPGWIETKWGVQVSRQRYQRLREEIPLQRWGTPADVANTVVWLASPAASYITGQTIRVNGGAIT